MTDSSGPLAETLGTRVPPSVREEISTALHRFANRVDLREWPLAARALEPAVLLSSWGKPGVRPVELETSEFLRRHAERLAGISTQHLVTNVELLAFSKAASVSASCVVHFRGDGRRGTTHAFHTFAMLEHEGEWTISGIRERILWSECEGVLDQGGAVWLV